MAGTTFQGRDCVPRSMEEKIGLKPPFFFSDQLFDGKAKPVVTWLEDSAQGFNLQKRMPHSWCLRTTSLWFPSSTWSGVTCSFSLWKEAELLTKLHQFNAQLLLVALAWPTPPWFPDLLELSIDHPQTTLVGQVPSGPGQAAASCLEVVRSSLSEASFFQGKGRQDHSPSGSVHQVCL